MCASHLDQLDEEFQSYMATLRETVQAKTAVPTSQVYVSIIDVTIQHRTIIMSLSIVLLIVSLPQPLFSSLSRVWSGFQDEVVLLSVLSTLISGVKPFTKARIDL